MGSAPPRVVPVFRRLMSPDQTNQETPSDLVFRPEKKRLGSRSPSLWSYGRTLRLWTPPRAPVAAQQQLKEVIEEPGREMSLTPHTVRRRRHGSHPPATGRDWRQFKTRTTLLWGIFSTKIYFLCNI